RQLLENGATFTHSRGSVSSDLEYDHGYDELLGHNPPASEPHFYRDPFSLNAAPPTPPVQSPLPQQSQLQVNSQLAPQCFSQDLTQLQVDPAQTMKPSFAMQTPQCDDSMGFYSAQYASPLTYEPSSVQFSQLVGQRLERNTSVTMTDWTGDMIGDEDFNDFLEQPMTR
ncbi:Fluconazole resistance protein 1, partial [Cryomyces antarcticus]